MRFLKIQFFLLIMLFPTILLSQSDTDNVVRFYMFTSDECETCAEFKEIFLPELEELYNIEYKEFEISDDKNFELLLDFEKQYGKENNDLPIIIISNQIVSGAQAETDLEPLIKKYSNTGCDYPNLNPNFVNSDTTSVESYDKTIYIAYFYKLGCNHCDRTSYDLKALRKKFPNIEIRKYDMSLNESMRINEAICQLYNVPEKLHQSAPSLFIGEDYLLNEDAKYSNILPLLQKYQETGTLPPWDKAKPFLSNTQQNIIGRFKSFGIFTIILAGLIDGINPCAFATLIFFISYLTLIGRKGKDVILIGISYTLAVFITYFAVGILGLGMLSFIQKLKMLKIIVDAVFLITGVIVLIFAFYSIRDYFLYRQGKISDMAMQLPKPIKQKIHKVIREKTKSTHFVLTAFVIGFLISLQELFCTGQVYLPTLIYMSRISDYKLLAFIYLTLYNLLFIVPLLVVFLLVYWGVTSNIIANWMKKNLGLMKILMAIIFLALGIVLIGAVFLR